LKKTLSGRILPNTGGFIKKGIALIQDIPLIIKIRAKYDPTQIILN